MERRNKILRVAVAVLAGVILLLATTTYISNKSQDAPSRGVIADPNFDQQYHRSLRQHLSFFSDPKSVILKKDDDAKQDLFHAISIPSTDNDNTDPLPFHLALNPQDAACDGIVLYITDKQSGYGLGSQFLDYLVAAYVASYLDKALVMVGVGNYGCPDDVLDAEALPKSFAGLIKNPAWLSRQCAVPCQSTHTLDDWNKILSGPLTHNPEVTCTNDNGRETNVVLMDRSTNYQHRGDYLPQMTDRSTEASLVQAYNWALRLGADINEASIFASLREEDDIWDYVAALASRSEVIQFQPWVSRDVETYIKENQIPSEEGEYVAIHVRRGDKLFRESKAFVTKYWTNHPGEGERKDYIPFRHYLSQLTGECGQRNVYVATDDPVEVKKEIENLPKDEQGQSYLEGNECAKFEFFFGPILTGYHNNDRKNEHKEKESNCKTSYHRIIASFADLTTLARSKTFVGEYNSNWGRFVRVFRLKVNDSWKVLDGEKPVIEKDIRIAWGETHTKHITSNTSIKPTSKSLTR